VIYTPNGTPTAQRTRADRRNTMNLNEMHIGQTVRNLGILAKVADFHEITGDPILRPFWNDGSLWLADAAKCEAADGDTSAVRHKDGLVCIG
jgi:hypothetical protein